jgi:hypothetical protein
MWKIMAAAAGLLVLPSAAVAQAKTELMIGFLDHSGGTISQALGVRNNGVRPIRAVRIACRFFRYSTPLAAGSIGLEDIAPDAASYATLRVASPRTPNRATCHAVSVER